MDWTIWIQFTLTGLGAIIAFSGLITSIGYLFGTLKKGKNQGEIDTVKILNDKIDALEMKVNDQQIQIDLMKKTIEEREEQLKALYKENLEKNKKIEEYLLIFKGRDPHFEEFVTLIKKYVETNIPLLQKISVDVIPVIEKLAKYLNKQTF